MASDHGHVFVTTHGFHLQTMGGLYQWTWDAVTAMNVVGFGIVELHGESSNGPVHWLLHTYAAELLFMLWAMARHPRHPQVVSNTWLPPHWVGWAAAQGHPVSLRALT